MSRAGANWVVLTSVCAALAVVAAGAGADGRSEDYLRKMIECSYVEERMIACAYDRVVGLSDVEFRQEGFKFPLRLVEFREGNAILSWSYYVTPNELRGFEIIVPAWATAEHHGVVTLRHDMVVVERDRVQNITILRMKPKAPALPSS